MKRSGMPTRLSASFALAVTMILLAACDPAISSRGVCEANPVLHYSPDLMATVADELDTLDRALGHPSRTRHVVGDYGIVRQRQRAICGAAGQAPG